LDLPLGAEKTDVLYGAENTTRAVITFFKNARTVSACADSISPSVAMGVDSIKKCYEDLKSRNAKVRWITDITKDNLRYCRALMHYAEVRHLDGVKGNFGVSDNAYIATSTVIHAQPVPELIYSTARSVVEQNRYVFDTLWNKAIPADDRINEIELGMLRPETVAVKDPMEILHRTMNMVSQSKEYSVCSNSNGLLYAHNYSLQAFKTILQLHASGKHKGIRWITNIENSQDEKLLQIIRTFINLGMQIRHISTIPLMSFGVSDKEIGLTVESLQGGALNASAIFSSERAFIAQFATIFEELWNRGVDAEVRMKEIESESGMFIDVIQSPLEIQDRYHKLALSAKQQILLFLPTTTAYKREEKIGIFQSLQEAAKRGVEIRILLPVREEIDEQIQEKIRTMQGFEIRKVKTTGRTETRSKILIMDRKQYLMVELKDDSKETFVEAVGSAIYSNSKSTVLSYVTMFDSLWAQSELYEKLNVHDRMQREFINIAAHELRTPAQSILGYSELLQNELDTAEAVDMLKALSRNAYRLQGLINDVLDVARIEGKTLTLQKTDLRVNEIIEEAISDAENQAKASGKVKVIYRANNAADSDVKINADKDRVLQVLSNIISNALKFTEEGTIELITERQDQYVVIKVKDSGSGIDPAIFPKLFEKFASKSNKGTGLGLFISRNIVEEHGGRIWAENNADGKGATFTFTLPTKND